MKKIMFNDKYGLTEAVLAYRKTMTRRNIPTDIYNRIDFRAFSEGNKECLFVNSDEIEWADYRYGAYYKLGEIVAIAQSYAELNAQCLLLDDATHTLANSKGWNNKMFVKASLMPHQIIITDVRIERLQDISDEDCMKEGILKKSDFPYKKTSPFYFAGGKHEWDNSFHTPRQAYAALIDKVSGKGTWKSNPYVFVYEFELIK